MVNPTINLCILYPDHGNIGMLAKSCQQISYIISFFCHVESNCSSFEQQLYIQYCNWRWFLPSNHPGSGHAPVNLLDFQPFGELYGERTLPDAGVAFPIFWPCGRAAVRCPSLWVSSGFRSKIHRGFNKQNREIIKKLWEVDHLLGDLRKAYMESLWKYQGLSATPRHC